MSRSWAWISSSNRRSTSLLRFSSAFNLSAKALSSWLRESRTSRAARPLRREMLVSSRENRLSIRARSRIRQSERRCWRAMASCRAASCRNFSFLTSGALMESYLRALASSISRDWMRQTHYSYSLVLSMSSFSRTPRSAAISALPALMRASSSRTSAMAFVFSSKDGLSITLTRSTSVNYAVTWSNFSVTVLFSFSSNLSLPRAALLTFWMCLFQLQISSRWERMACTRGAGTYCSLSFRSTWIKSVSRNSNPVARNTSRTTRKSEMIGRDSRWRSRSSQIRWHSMARMLRRQAGSKCFITSTITLRRLRPSRQCSIMPRSLLKLKPMLLRKERMRSKD